MKDLGLTQLLPPSSINPSTPISVIIGRTLERINDLDDEVVDLGDYFSSKFQKGVLQITPKKGKLDEVGKEVATSEDHDKVTVWNLNS